MLRTFFLPSVSRLPVRAQWPIPRGHYKALSNIRAMSTSSMVNVEGASFNIALIQLGGIGANKLANLLHARAMIAEAARGDEKGLKPQVVVLPEIFNSLYGSSYFDTYAEVIGWHESKGSVWDADKCSSPSIKMLSSAAREEQVWLFGGQSGFSLSGTRGWFSRSVCFDWLGSIPERSPDDPKVLYNSAPVFQPDGKLVALHRKLHLFDIDIPNQITFKESETLSAGSDPVTIVETPFGKIGLGICYDIRFPEMAMIAARRGCIAMIYPGAFNLTTGPLHWELLQRARAVDNLIYVAACSPARNPSSAYQAWGHSSIIDPMSVEFCSGNALIRGAHDTIIPNHHLYRARVISTSDEVESIVHGKIDIAELIAARKGLPVTTQRRFDVYPDVSKPI
ncbi:uncharacterized protein VP01_224g1 [Puccinia sorghi]|uniref:CN hydrolase domain-containing protein n=1 Tax=Puccinia sorghi TaxID=27349 RepID=A0A0L6V8H7_9BASI|nr:uncharacterized protein VP01_224g1 [Puccinia sorghi]